MRGRRAGNRGKSPTPFSHSVMRTSSLQGVRRPPERYLYGDGPDATPRSPRPTDATLDPVDTRLAACQCSAWRDHVEPDASRQAEAYFQAAYAAQMRGDLDEAIGLYRQSLASVPTAEAHTFLGWALSGKGDYEGRLRARAA